MPARKTSAQIEQDAAPVATGPRLLDLDAEQAAIEANRQSVRVDGSVIWLRSAREFAMAEKETVRKLILRQKQVAQTPLILVDGDEGMTREAQQALLETIERQLLELIVIDPLPESILASSYTRDRLCELFTIEAWGWLQPLVLQMMDLNHLQISQMVQRLTEQEQIIQALRASTTSGEPGTPTASATASSPPTSATSTAAA